MVVGVARCFPGMPPKVPGLDAQLPREVERPLQHPYRRYGKLRCDEPRHGQARARVIGNPAPVPFRTFPDFSGLSRTFEDFPGIFPTFLDFSQTFQDLPEPFPDFPGLDSGLSPAVPVH
eukprot:gene17735-biopygen9414